VTTRHYDIVVVGSGPSGHKAAICGAKAGRRVLIIEEERGVGGACVHQGTIPSKTLRETAVTIRQFQRRTGGILDVVIPDDVQVRSLMVKLDDVVRAHESFMADQLRRNGVERLHGRGRFVGLREIEVRGVDGTAIRVTGDLVIIATGSRPRVPEGIPIDHEHILDSDSLLSMIYLPRSLTVLGAGVIACEYASIFACLGVEVVMLDKAPRPIGFLDPELTFRFVRLFEQMGGRFVANAVVESVEWDGVSAVVTTLKGGEQFRSDKLVSALGRVANVERLDLSQTGLAPNSRGFIEVDAQYRTKVPGICAVGDVIGAPSLASTGMDQGRRAVCHALGLDPGAPTELVPLGVYTVPEMSSVGLTEAEAVSRFGQAVVGRAQFHELARGQISSAQDGLLKLVADPAGKLVGVQIIGEGAAELIHVGQMALLGRLDIRAFVDNAFNFPTLAEGYRVAALDALARVKTTAEVVVEKRAAM
jgi:NAD(P) transhydrogenase